MKLEIGTIYEKKDKRKKQLLSLKNNYFAIIYSGCIAHKPIRKIHKELFDATINRKSVQADKLLLGYAIKLSNKAHKLEAETGGLLAIALLNMFKNEKINDKARKIINHTVSTDAEKEKLGQLDDFIAQNKQNGRWFYLASSHNDCAKDHKDWQGKLYVDKDAPAEIIDYARKRGLYTMQWVIDSPVWFITRPNCRHYFVSLSYDEVNKKSLKKLKKKHKTHSEEGNRKFQTPPRIALEEYEDRLRMLRALYREYPTKELKIMIEKTELLIKKWKKAI